MPVVMGFGALFGSVQGMMSLFGSRLDSFTSEDDAFESKEIKRRTTKIPVEQTLAEIGERRGSYRPWLGFPNACSLTDWMQAFTLLATRRGGDRGSRTSMALRSTPSVPPPKAASRLGRRGILYISLRG